MNATLYWNRFIEHLNTVNPLGKRDEITLHVSMIGSIAKYKKIFEEANTPKKNILVPNEDGSLPEITINPDRIELDEAYMQMAEVWAKRSKANKLQVGSLIVKDNKICSDGYNGMPAGWDDDTCEIWSETGRLISKPEVFHAESNAINKASRRGGTGLDGAELYCTHSPCPECVKLIKQNNISRVIYRNLHKSDGLDMLKNLKVDVTHLPYTE